MLPGTTPSQPPPRPLIEWPCNTQQGLLWWLSPRQEKWLPFVLSCDSRFRQCTNPQAAAINFLLMYADQFKPNSTKWIPPTRLEEGKQLLTVSLCERLWLPNTRQPNNDGHKYRMQVPWEWQCLDRQRSSLIWHNSIPSQAAATTYLWGEKVWWFQFCLHLLFKNLKSNKEVTFFSCSHSLMFHFIDCNRYLLFYCTF